MSEQADRVRRERRHWAVPGSSHDRVIHIARIVLPIGIGGMAALLATAPIAIGRDISFVLSRDRVAVAKERMRVSNASYRGQDSKGQPFMISAKSAVQTKSSDPVVRLTDLAAVVWLNDGPAAIAANRGRYDMKSEQVSVDGPVFFKTHDGYRLLTRDVAIDLKTRRVASQGEVDGIMPLGTFHAGHLRADIAQHSVTLEDRARLHIVQRQSRGK